MGNLLIIQPKVLLKAEQLDCLQKYFAKQKETGVVVLPRGCEIISVPDDTEILFKYKEKDVDEQPTD